MRINNDSGFFSALEFLLRPMAVSKYRNYELPDTFQQRIGLIQSIKTAYRIDKEIFINIDDINLEHCLNHLNIDEDLTSLALMISGNPWTSWPKLYCKK